MKKAVYAIFTVENRIRMDAGTLEYITSSVRDSEDIRSLLNEFKARFNTSTVDSSQIRELLTASREERPFFAIEPTTYRANSLPVLYDSLKKHLTEPVSPISLLGHGVPSIIYGIFYRSSSGQNILEDEHGTVVLDLAGCAGDIFLFENMFVAAEGGLFSERVEDSDPVFSVTRFILPAVQPHSRLNGFLLQKDLRIIAFSCFTNQTALVEQVIGRHSPDVVVLSICSARPALAGSSIIENLASRHFSTRFITYPCRCTGRHLPDRVNGLVTTNPFTLNLYDGSIAFIESNIFEHKRNGLFLGKNSQEAFLKTFLSQGSYNPFEHVNLYRESLPKIIVVSQRFYPFVTRLDGIQIISLSPIADEGTYALIDTSAGEAEIYQYKSE